MTRTDIRPVETLIEALVALTGTSVEVELRPHDGKWRVLAYPQIDVEAPTAHEALRRAIADATDALTIEGTTK